MRFTANGPNISDELLNARDQGRVVFICGAGVSRARAGLPDFWGLAEKVASALGVLPEEKISQIIQSAKKPNADGFISISADRLFGMLEQDFEIEDIYSAVSGALKHDVDCDLAAHQILIDLATTREGLVRIVTTNFDLLFEACNANLLSHVPPKLPDPKRPKEFNGIVYLHGRVDDGYFGAKADGFVLSSSEFGQAYLADGWATRFIKEILNNYIVVFVGYSADDPPIQYLLEALKKYPTKCNDIYAFHGQGNDEHQSHWAQKGVIPIVYSDANQHKELWDTLEVWARRARNPAEWNQSLVREALKGPESLEPHIRGQVAHLVSSYEGMKYFCGGDAVPPSEWLAVFDPRTRLENVSNRMVPQDSIIRSNIDKYGLDGESLNEIDPAQRNVIDPNAWNAFSLNYQDFLSAKTEHLSALVGEPKSASAQLLPRFSRFAWWISKVCRETYAIEWALNQNFLHPTLCQYISQSIKEKNKGTPSAILEAWRYILESKSEVRDDLGIYEIARQIKAEGWSNRIVRKFANFHAPWISTAPAFRDSSRPVEEVNALKLRDLVRLEVKCGHFGRPDFDIPNEWLSSVIAAFRVNLLSAINGVRPTSNVFNIQWP